MDTIICLVGPSGVGKTTIAKRLEERGINVIQSYTTRPPRQANEWGHTFVGADEAIFEQGWKGDNVIAYQELYGYHYWATREQYQGKGVSLYVVDPNGAEEMLQNVEDAYVFTVLLWVNGYERFERLKQGRTLKSALERQQQDKDMFEIVSCDLFIDTTYMTVDKVEQILMKVVDFACSISCD